MNIKSKAVLAYVIIFLVGGASGFFLNVAISPPPSLGEMERGVGMNREFPPGRKGEIPPRMRNFMIERLDLRNEQVEPFFEVQSEHLQNLYERMGQHNEQRIEMLRQMYSDFVDDVDEILTEEQMRELNSFAHPDSIHQKRMHRRRQGRSR